MIRFPKPLQSGDIIGVTAPSSGVSQKYHARLEIVLQHLRSQGFLVVEGQCLRQQHKDASSSRQKRSSELIRFLTDSEIAAVFPPWGGELAIELLELIDFDSLRSLVPKWLLGFSDLSTLQVPLTLISGWATAHGANLMDLSPTQTDPLTTSVLSILASKPGVPIIQKSSLKFQKQWNDFTSQPDIQFALIEPTVWKRLDGSNLKVEFEGRLIGGCLNILIHLADTRFGDIPRFRRKFSDDGTVLYFENVDMKPCALVRALWGLKLKGWFQGLSGVLIGRSAAPDDAGAQHLSYVEAIHKVLSDIKCPVIFDVDIGHRPPQITLINGAVAKVTFEMGRGVIIQHYVGQS